MATIKDIHNPSFILFPINNNRTAWQPFGLPTILVIPHRRSPNSAGIPNSEAFNVRIFIEDVPQEALIAGHQYIGQRFPNNELYSQTLTALDLRDRAIDLDNISISRNGNAVDLIDAKTGDIIKYTSSAGVIGEFEFISGADYYDLSDIKIEVELLPHGEYNLVYSAEYFTRTISTDGLNEFLCINSNSKALTKLTFKIDHPGKVLSEFYKLTPQPYLTNSKKSLDQTVRLYRPFTDILNDLLDEQNLIPKINWVFDAPPEAIPYLSSLLGWDIPYFPESLDKLRKAVLRRTVEFQNLKGSRRAITNIFRLFGFEILISNLWWSSDGKRLIRPDENLPFKYKDEKITTVSKFQIDPLLSEYSSKSFTSVNIPLLYRPQELKGLDTFTALRDGGQLTVLAYTALKNSPADITLKNITAQINNNPSSYGETADCVVDNDGYIFPNKFSELLSGKQIYGFSELKISGKLGLSQPNNILAGPIVPIIKDGVSLNRETNTLSLTLNGNSQFDGHNVYAFAVYKRYEFNVPKKLANLNSNRFDIQVLTESLSEFANPTVLEFAIEFLYRLKAFHSLLNVIRTSVDLNETYEVTDLCVGGDFIQRFDTSIGRLQVPPAIIPNIPTDPNDCALYDPRSIGYKDSDILLRIRKITNVTEEFEAWKSLDDRKVIQGDTRVSPNVPIDATCNYNHYGQARILVQQRTDVREHGINPNPNSNMGDSGFKTNQLSPNDIVNNGEYDNRGQLNSSNSNSSAFGAMTREFTSIRQQICELDGVTDYCYKGRVEDEILHRQTILNDETVGLKPPVLGMGEGVYWTYPTKPIVITPGVKKPDPRSSTNRIRYSGGATSPNEQQYNKGNQKEYLDVAYDKPLPKLNNSTLGRMYRDYSNPKPQTLHYSNRIVTNNVEQQYQLALSRPSLNVQKTTMHLPGCRFPTLSKLETDYTSTTYTARPWDFDPCGPIRACGTSEPNYLNYTIVVVGENEYLQFDNEMYSVRGNRLPADISSFGTHTLDSRLNLTESDIIHKVYMNGANSNPAVTLDGVCDYDTTTVDGVIATDDPLFKSHMECGTSFKDFADGYACVSGQQSQFYDDRNEYDEILSYIGLDRTAETINYLFSLSSGIRDASIENYRLDLGCTTIGCDNSINYSEMCIANQYLDDDYKHDFSPDHLRTTTIISNVESIETGTFKLDGTIPSLMELI